MLERLETTLNQSGAAAALIELCHDREAASDAGGLFYALLMQSRWQLGVAPTPTRPTSEMPDTVLDQYEESIRTAARRAGELCLKNNDIPRAWNYYRMIGEPDAVKAALDRYLPGPEDDLSPILDIALQQNAHPTRGFDLVLDHHGICSAISAYSAFEHQWPTEVKHHAISRMVITLREQIIENLRATIAAREGSIADTLSMRELIQHRDWLFGDDGYYVDLSHLQSIVQFSLDLPPGAALDAARELCQFGSCLSDRFRISGSPPFADGYKDYGAYLAIVASDRVDEHLQHFYDSANDPDNGTTPAEILVALLCRIGREHAALEVATKHLSDSDSRHLMCPGPMEIAYRIRDFDAMAELAKGRDDAVHFLAAKLEQRRLPK